MTDDDIGRLFNQYTNRGWSNPTPWEKIDPATKKLWIFRAKRQLEKELAEKENNE